MTLSKTVLKNGTKAIIVLKRYLRVGKIIYMFIVMDSIKMLYTESCIIYIFPRL